MPASFDRFGISFQYPDNWTLETEEDRGGVQSVTVQSPTGAFWTVAIHLPGASAEAVLATGLKVMRQLYDELDSEPVTETVLGKTLHGQDLNFYCLDLTNTAWLRALATDEATFLIMYQAEDRDLDEVEAVLRAITISFLKN